MEEKISVLMTAYNAENDITKAIESVQKQSYKNWELIVIDDCSTDKTAKVVKDLASKDERIRYVKTKSNQGCGGARKYGMQYVTGQWIAFIDSDDTYNSLILEGLYKACKKANAKLAHCSCVFVYEDGRKPQPIMVKDEVLEGHKAFTHGMTNNIYRCAWNGLSHISLWEDIEYNNFKCLDDMLVGMELLLKTNKHVTISYVGYNYLQRENSVFHNNNKQDILVHNVAIYLELNKWEKYHLDSNITKPLVWQAIKKYMDCSTKEMRENNKTLAQYPNLANDLCEFILYSGLSQ